jgi:hypothetical protein
VIFHKLTLRSLMEPLRAQFAAQLTDHAQTTADDVGRK